MAKVAGSIWVEGNDLHYIDAYNREWYSPGTFKKGVSGARAGSLWQDSGTDAGIWYVNEAANGIYRTPIAFVKFLPLNSRICSLWVGTDNLLHWNWYYDGAKNQELSNHWDVAPTSTHTDSHSDTGHVDIPHNNIAHNDVHGDWSHVDWHGDVPHQDHYDGSHNDTHTDSGKQFNDHIDCTGTAQLTHSDGSVLCNVHDDCWSTQYEHHTDQWWYNYPCFYPHSDGVVHQDIPHDDTHGDSHYDAPHQDSAASSSHGDFWDLGAHTDVPHTDVAHNDQAHVDSHSDSHGDTPHTDHPIYIGP